ncbi:MAG: SulP family inorganic anion transporter [Gammaproteobacteria bacterium]|nr:SulP family inorganic anion transporter [Gammaproteobacteria bacterium]
MAQSRFTNFLPGLRVLSGYQKKDLGPDVISGLVMCLVLIPAALAYAELAGFGPIAGIYSAIAATLAYFLFTSSRHMNVGPDGAVALLVGAAILPLTGGDPAKAIIAGTWLAIFTGLILIMAAKFKLGAVASFLSTPVLLGYLNGAALVIIISQWGKLFGVNLEQEGLVQRVIEWVEKVPNTHLSTLYTGVATLVLLVIFKRLITRIPPLVPVFFLALVCGLLIDFNAMGVGIIGTIKDITPKAMEFTFNLNDVATLAMGALGMSMLIFPEGILLSRAMAEKHDYEIDPDRELMALGMSNLATGAVQGFAVGGSQTRTLLNSASGGRTQVANLASVVFLIGFLVLAAETLTQLPSVTIAAILVYTGFGLIDIKDVKNMWNQHRQTAWIAITTTAAVVFIGVLPGILLGTAFSIAILLADLARPHDALLVRKPGSDELHDMGDDDQTKGIPGLVAYRFYGPLVFANASFFMERLQGFIDQQEQPVHKVVIDARAIPSVDFTAREKLRPFFQKLEDRGIELAIARAHLPLREVRLSSGLEPIFSEDNIFGRVSDAVRAFNEKQKNKGL